MKKFFGIVMCLLIILLSVSVGVSAAEGITYRDVAFKLLSTQQYKNGYMSDIISAATGKLISCEVVPKEAGGKAMIPLRSFAEAFGAVVSWNQPSGSQGQATIRLSGWTLIFTINSRQIARKDARNYDQPNITIPSDYPPAMIIDNNTYIPLRTVMEAFGYKVDYRAAGYEDGLAVGYCLITSNPDADVAYFDALTENAAAAFEAENPPREPEGLKAVMLNKGGARGGYPRGPLAEAIDAIYFVSLDVNYANVDAFKYHNPYWRSDATYVAIDVTDATSDYYVYAASAGPDLSNHTMSLHIGGKGGITAPESCENLFKDFIAAIVFDGNFDTSNVINMSGMFNNCKGIPDKLGYYSNFRADFSGFDTSNVTNMSKMFENSNPLTLDLSSLDTGNVTDMSGMFSGCSKLTTLKLSKADFSNVTSYDDMFKDCNANLVVTVKDAAAKAFIEARGIPSDKVVIA